MLNVYTKQIRQMLFYLQVVSLSIERSHIFLMLQLPYSRREPNFVIYILHYDKKITSISMIFDSITHHFKQRRVFCCWSMTYFKLIQPLHELKWANLYKTYFASGRVWHLVTLYIYGLSIIHPKRVIMEKKNVQSAQKCNINLIEAHDQWLYSMYVKFTFNHYQGSVV